MDSDFNPEEYLYKNHARLPIDATFWTKIKSADGKNPIDSKGFYVPSSSLYSAWPDTLKLKYGIKEDIFYDPEIAGLALEVTPEMIKKAHDDWYKNCAVAIDSKTGKPIDTRPKNMTPERFLEFEKIKIAAKQSAREFSHMFGKSNESPVELTDWERRVVQWREGYGFLVDKDDMSGFLFPRPRDISALKQEVVREYFFHIPEHKAESINVGYYAGVILSLAQEPNSNRAVWGFRRDFATDWPKKFPQEYVVQMSNLMRNLEEILK